MLYSISQSRFELQNGRSDRLSLPPSFDFDMLYWNLRNRSVESIAFDHLLTRSFWLLHDASLLLQAA